MQKGKLAHSLACLLHLRLALDPKVKEIGHDLVSEVLDLLLRLADVLEVDVDRELELRLHLLASDRLADLLPEGELLLAFDLSPILHSGSKAKGDDHGGVVQTGDGVLSHLVSPFGWLMR